MKKKPITLTVIILLFVFSITASSIESENLDSEIELRVGLKTYYEDVSSITFYNSTISMGYNDGDGFVEEQVFTSSSNFKFTPFTSYCLISDQYFYTYDEAFTKVSMLREQNYTAYVGSASQGIWKVYVGNESSQSGAETIKSAIDSLYDLTYSVNGDNGHRTMMSYSASYSIIFENSYQQATFMSNDSVNGVNVLSLGDRSYRGKMEVGRYGGSSLTAINVIALNDYLYGVLPGEMPSSWPLEALKAQAVAARNYGIYYAFEHEKYPNEPYAICDTTSSQVYKGFLVEKDTAIQAVDETSGMMIYYEDTIIPAYFFSSSGGHTEDSENVWSGTVAYLKGVEDTYETDPEREPWLKSFTASEIADKLAKYGVYIGTITDIEVSDYTDAGRALSLVITGTNGEYELVKETMRYWLGLNSRKFTLVTSDYQPDTTYDVLGSSDTSSTIDYSNAYAINSEGSTNKLSVANSQVIVMSGDNIHSYPILTGQNNTFIFVGQGWGHGVGMSQSGAKGMALSGFTYDEILEHYYTGTEVKQYEETEEE